jgi:HlyD family secretion protein
MFGDMNSTQEELIDERTPQLSFPDSFHDAQPLRGRRWIVAVAMLSAASVAVIVFGYHRLQSPPAIHCEIVRVSRGEVVQTVTATGTLSALVTVQVGSQVSGTIQKLYVDYNSHVAKDEVIAQVDPALFRAAWLQAKADLAEARANLVSARANVEKTTATEVEAAANYRRSLDLADAGVISRQQFDQDKANAATAAADVSAAQAGVTQAEAQVQFKQAALDTAETNLSYTRIRAPVSGTVISRNIDVGQTVAAAFQSPVLFNIAKDLRKMQVDTSVGESDVGKLRPGMPGTFTVDAFPYRRFAGNVSQIRNSAQTIQNVVTYDAVIDVDNPQLKLRPGMTASVEFVVANAANVLRVPNVALLFKPDPTLLHRLSITVPSATIEPAADTHIVWVLRNGKPVAISIRTGISDGSLTAVLQGDIRPGDVLITDMTAASTGSLL